MKVHHGMYDNLYTAEYEAWLAGKPFGTTGGSQSGGPDIYGDDVRMSNPSFNGNQNEFQIAINPSDTRFAIGASNASAGVGVYRTSDGGQTWIASYPPSNGCCDPAIAYGSDGVAYLGILGSPGQITFRSTDNGATWNRVRDPSPVPDRNNIAVDPRDSNIVYTTYSDLTGASSNRIKGYKSTDGGQTWGPSFFIGGPAPPDGYEQSSQPRVASDGTIYVGYQQYQSQTIGCSAPVQNAVAKSTDGGQTWTQTVMDIRQGGACTGGQAGRGIFCTTGGNAFRSRSHPILSISPTNPNTVYMVYSGGDLGLPYTCQGASGYHSDILFRKSTDGGLTFSDPFKINTDPPGSDHYFPWMDVAPNGRIWVGWNDRRGDPQDIRSRWYQAFSTDEGKTWTEERVATVDTTPSGFIGDYHGLAAQNDRVLGMWYDSRVNASGDPFTNPNYQFDLAVIASNPANNSFVAAPPKQYVITLSDPYDASSVHPDALTVNGMPADNVDLTSPTTLTFNFTVNPVAQEGLQTMAIKAGAILRGGDENPVQAFNASFRYDSIRISVDKSDPPDGSQIELPFSDLQLHFNEPFDPKTVSTSNLTLSQGTVTSAQVLDAQTIDYTLSGITTEGALTVRIAAGALTDLYGNPNVAYQANYTVSIGQIPFPTPLRSRGTLGSWVYDTSASATITPPDDVDGYTITLNPHQQISVVVTPTTPGGLKPHVELYAVPSNGPVLLASATADAVGHDAFLQAIPTADDLGGNPPAPLGYLVQVSSADSTMGGYRVQLILNAGVDAETHNGAPNPTLDTAQDLDPTFHDLVAGTKGPALAAVLGTADFSAGLLPNEIEPNNTLQTANNASANFMPFKGNLYHMGIKGEINPGSDQDWINIGTLNAGDVITISEAGNGSRRGTLGDAYVELYRGPASAPVRVAFNDDGGVSFDSLIFRFHITQTDTYYIDARSCCPPTGFSTGLYDLGIWLEPAGPGPMTGGRETQEHEPNETALTANDFSDSWRPVQYMSQTQATISPAGDTDFYKFRFTAGDLVTVNMHSTSTMHARVNLLNAAGGLLGMENGTSQGPGNDSPLYAFIIPSTGDYYIQVSATGSGPVGTYNADVFLSADTPPPEPSLGYDYFGLSLSAGESATVGLTGLPSTAVHVELVDATDTVIATGQRGATNFTEVISDFVAPTDGRYYVRVFGSIGLDYNLLVARDTELDTENNDDFAHAQAIASTPVDGTQWVAGHTGQLNGSVRDTDVYQVSLAEGSTLILETFTPSDHGGDFDNTFDPKLVVYDATGKEVAEDDNSAPDRRNALLVYRLPEGGAGNYFIRVLASDLTPTPTQGEYILEVQGAGAGPGMSPSPGPRGGVPVPVTPSVSMISVVSFLIEHHASVAVSPAGLPAGQISLQPPMSATSSVPLLPASNVDTLLAMPNDDYSWITPDRMRPASPLLGDEGWWESA